MALSPKRRPGRLLLLGAGLGSLVFASPASANLISPETPHSPGAEDSKTLYWIALVAILAVVVAINVAIFVAVRRYRSERGSEPRQVTSGGTIQVRVASLLGVFALALFILGIVFTNKARDLPASDAETVEITATGQQWLWRYNYPNGTDSYYQLVVPVDTNVDLKLLSTDVTHSWFVPELSGKFEAVPGKQNHLTFNADEMGTYDGQSATFSGSAYGAMRTEVKVVSQDDYESFIAQQKKDIQAAQDSVAQAPAAAGGAN